MSPLFHNAAVASDYGSVLDFDTFQKMAGALHVFGKQGKNLDDMTLADIFINGTSTWRNRVSISDEQDGMG